MSLTAMAEENILICKKIFSITVVHLQTTSFILKHIFKYFFKVNLRNKMIAACKLGVEFLFPFL